MEGDRSAGRDRKQEVPPQEAGADEGPQRLPREHRRAAAGDGDVGENLRGQGWG